MVKSKLVRVFLAILFINSLLLVNLDDYGWSSGSSGQTSSSSSKSSSKSSSSSSGSYGSSVSKPSSSSSSSSSSSAAKPSSPATGGYGSSVSKPASAPAESSGSSVSKPSSTASGSYGSSVSKPSSSSAETSADSVAKPSASGYGSSVTKPSESGSTASVKGDGGSSGQSVKPAAGPGEKNSAPPPPKTALQQKIDRTYSKQESAKALESYKAEQNRFKERSNPFAQSSGGERAAVNNIQSKVTYRNEGDYFNRREVFYSSSGWSPPSYVYRSYNSFGIWDSMMLWYMLDHIHDAQYRDLYYHHRNDPGMQQFRQELDKMAEENSDLKAKVAQLDAETRALEAKGVKVDPNYVPSEAADVVLAADIAKKEIQVKKESGFPWMWTLAIVAGLGIALLFFKKRS